MAAAEATALLRFLTQDAKLPLAEVMPKIGILMKKGLRTPLTFCEADVSSVKDVFVEEKLVKQVINASKRLLNPKKRTASQSSLPRNKRLRTNDYSGPPRDIEAELTLPSCELSANDLGKLQIEANRAPLVLAFALVSLEFSMPDQPLSSRLSLAQALVSANSQSKAKSIGLASGATAEDEGWASGQPKVRVMGREIAVMRRQIQIKAQEDDSQETTKADDVVSHEAFWGLDLEALRKANGPLVAGKMAVSHGPPVHSPQAARAYLLKSMSIVRTSAGDEEPVTTSKKKQTPAEVTAVREQAVAALLESIRLVCRSWTSTISAADLGGRAWSWYISVRPDVAQGQSGWGQRGKVKLADILKLRKDQ